MPVALSETERDEFYYGYSNEVIWPLFHDLQNFCNFEPGYWQTYKAVNDRFADAIARCAQPNDFIWVHDYHLMNVAQALRERGVSQKLSGLTFFLHIPFPPYDIFSSLPQQAATTGAPSIRSAWVPDTARRSQLSRLYGA